MNSPIAMSSRLLRPMRSPSLPYTGIMMVAARMYAVVIHSMWLTPSSSPTIVG